MKIRKAALAFLLTAIMLVGTGYGGFSLLAEETTGTIHTEDTAGLIDISLYDYDVNEVYSDLCFLGDPGWNWPRYNRWVGAWGYSNDHVAVQGIMDRNLYTKDGYITTAEDNYEGFPVVTAGGRMAYTNARYGLLSEQTCVASGLNHLFVRDAQGYYSYDSAKNYAYYDTSENNSQKDFTVYDVPKNGNFMPLRDITESESWYYGMTVGFNFIQPQNGQVEGQDMTFSFSGDDDVWIFVDGRLVLDLGGIHSKVGGTINFATGEVKVDGVVNEADSGIGNTLGQTTSLQQIFGLEKATFEDCSEHRLEFIYLERGATVSNCSLKFNMPPVPKDALKITKQITNTDKQSYANVEFPFKVYLEKENGTDIFEPMPEGTTYQIWEDGVDTGQRSAVSEDGSFRLKDGQTAVFPDIMRNLKYYVEETEIQSDEYDQVSLSNGEVTYLDGQGNTIAATDGTVAKETGTYAARSEIRKVGGNSSIVFKNQCARDNIRNLQITKRITDGFQTDDVFDFLVQLEDKEGKLVPYQGDYFVVKDGNYYMRDADGNLALADSQTVCGNTQSGEISGIPADYTIQLTGLIAGTDFKVDEINLDTEQYNGWAKELQDETAEPAQIADADGCIRLGSDAQLTITNDPKGNLYVQKTWTGDDIEHSPVYVGLYHLDENGNYIPVENTVKELNSSNNWQVVYEHLDAPEQYRVKELKEVQTEDACEFEVTDGNTTRYWEGMESGERMKEAYLDYQVSYGELQQTEEGKRDYMQVITNTMQEREVYELPEAGGVGNGRFLFAGIAFLMTASVVLIHKIKFQNI